MGVDVDQRRGRHPLISLYVAWWLVGGVIESGSVPSPASTPSTSRGGARGRRCQCARPAAVEFDGVGFTYPSAPTCGAPLAPALNDVARIDPGELVAIVRGQRIGQVDSCEKSSPGVRRPPDMCFGPAIRDWAARRHRDGAAATGNSDARRPRRRRCGVGLADGVDVDVDALLAEVGLSGLADRDTADLSGGQQRAFALAAALARDPALLIADEGDLDGRPGRTVRSAGGLDRIAARRGLAVVLITHRADGAAAADRVIHLRDGRVDPQPPVWFGGRA